jgi:endogenous inhibitor of DNA gyrase (YacG/DUF329 family)
MGDAQLCVMCRTRPVDPQWRPFCSERCRNEDLARWAEGTYRLPSETAPSADEEDQDQNHGE